LPVRFALTFCSLLVYAGQSFVTVFEAFAVFSQFERDTTLFFQVALAAQVALFAKNRYDLDIIDSVMQHQ